MIRREMDHVLSAQQGELSAKYFYAGKVNRQNTTPSGQRPAAFVIKIFLLCYVKNVL